MPWKKLLNFLHCCMVRIQKLFKHSVFEQLKGLIHNPEGTLTSKCKDRVCKHVERRLISLLNACLRYARAAGADHLQDVVSAENGICNCSSKIKQHPEHNGESGDQGQPRVKQQWILPQGNLEHPLTPLGSLPKHSRPYRCLSCSEIIPCLIT